MKTTLIATAFVAGLALLASGCGWHKKDPAQKAEYIAKKLAKKLDLSPEQRAKAQPLVEALVQERQAWVGEGPKALGELRAQFEAGSFDAAALTKASEAREKKLAGSRALLVQKLAEFHAILTPEQRSKAAGYLAKAEQRWLKHSQRHAPKP